MLHPVDLAICSGAGVFSVLWFEALKIFSRVRVEQWSDRGPEAMG